MRAFTAAALLASSCLFQAAIGAPNFEISKTSLSVDRHREALDNGEILVRVQRTDDLFSDPSANEDAKLLLEKNTHIALRIQLDSVAGTVNVNDEPLDLASDDSRVTAIKAEAFRLPAEHDSPVADADMMLSLLGQMSPGIVGVEVKVESSPITPKVGIVDFGTGDAPPTVNAVSIRKVGLWIRVFEIEGKQLPHTTSIYTPILQLVVTGSEGKVMKIETLSVDGRDPVNEALSAPGPVMTLPNGAFPEVDPVMEKVDQEHQNHSAKPEWRPKSYLKKGGCKGMRKEAFRKEAGAARVKTHRPKVENPFSGMMDEEEGYASDASTEANVSEEAEGAVKDGHRFGHAHGQDHHHGHRRHGRCGGFFRRMAIGFVTGMALFASVVFHPISLMVASGLITFAILFHGVRRIMQKRRRGQVALGEEADEVLFEHDDKDEKVPILTEVVVEKNAGDKLPKYEESS
ncbi:MAG: hypothetical protein CYPHOPRED_000223 [Cyphobasidiales sp. Tagirdzhanova-0007]|nr:MAG: hypothetical protein CYPHOPRED_000223 [Cyphobasidiales sp. Tagirdzhanova-0007]